MRAQEVRNTISSKCIRNIHDKLDSWKHHPQPECSAMMLHRVGGRQASSNIGEHKRHACDWMTQTLDLDLAHKLLHVFTGIDLNPPNARDTCEVSRWGLNGLVLSSTLPVSRRELHHCGRVSLRVSVEGAASRGRDGEGGESWQRSGPSWCDIQQPEGRWCARRISLRKASSLFLPHRPMKCMGGELTSCNRRIRSCLKQSIQGRATGSIKGTIAGFCLLAWISINQTPSDKVSSESVPDDIFDMMVQLPSAVKFR
eukprot:766778-Hanusia_phi.AAC.5